MLRKLITLNLVFAFFSLALNTSCQSGGEENNSAQTPGPDEDYLVTVSTQFGDIQLVLFDKTPRHKANFIKLIQENYYDDLLFHRCMSEFMIQGGDPDSRTARAGEALGIGTPGYTLEAEITPDLFHQKGALAAARLPDGANPQKESNGGQFYIVHGRKWTEQEVKDLKINYLKLQELFSEMLRKPEFAGMAQKYYQLQNAGDPQAMTAYMIAAKDTIEQVYKVKLSGDTPPDAMKTYTEIGGAPMLDGEYTVFGQTVAGFEVIDKIAAQPTDARARPNEDVKMKISLEIVPKSRIKELLEKRFAAK